MKLVHLSDTHLGRAGLMERFQRVIDDLCANPDTAADQCSVLHTGDLIDSATEAHMALGRAALDQLHQRGYRVILCPGNHDYGNAAGIDSAAATRFRARFSDVLFAGQAAQFPVLHILNDHQVLVVLDSNEGELSGWHRWFAEGCIGPGQLQRLNTLLDRPETRQHQVLLALHHHPFRYGSRVAPDVGDGHLLHHLFVDATRGFRRLKDAYSLCETVRARVQVLLFGHRHFGLNCSSDASAYDIPLALDGGSSTNADNDADRLRYRIVDLQTLRSEVRTLP